MLQIPPRACRSIRSYSSLEENIDPLWCEWLSESSLSLLRFGRWNIGSNSASFYNQVGPVPREWEKREGHCAFMRGREVDWMKINMSKKNEEWSYEAVDVVVVV